MSNIYKYLFISCAVLSLFAGIKLYFLNSDYTELNEKYVVLQAQYAVEKSNGVTLTSTIQYQNTLIDQYKTNTQKYTETINNLNNKLDELNKIDIQYDYNKDNTSNSEDVLKWLKQKASSLVP